MLTTLFYVIHRTHFADTTSEYGLIPNEVRDVVHRFYETGKSTDHHLKCRFLQAVKRSISTNKKVEVRQIVMLLKKHAVYIESGIESMKGYLCKLLCVRGKGMGLIYNVHSTTSPNSTSISIS